MKTNLLNRSIFIKNPKVGFVICIILLVLSSNGLTNDSIRPISVSKFEPSGITPVKEGWLIADDELVSSVIFFEKGKKSSQVVKLLRSRKNSEPISNNHRFFSIQDFEGLAGNGKKDIFLIGSHQPSDENYRRTDREFLISAKWKYSKKEQELKFEHIYEDLLEDLPGLFQTIDESIDITNKKASSRVNIEGLAYDKRSDRLYIGFRYPLNKSAEAILISVSAHSLFTSGHKPDFKMHEIDLEGMGVRSLQYYNGSLLIVSGPAEEGSHAQVYQYDLAKQSVDLKYTFTDVELCKGKCQPEGIYFNPKTGKTVFAMDGDQRGQAYLIEKKMVFQAVK